MTGIEGRMRSVQVHTREFAGTLDMAVASAQGIIAWLTELGVEVHGWKLNLIIGSDMEDASSLEISYLQPGDKHRVVRSMRIPKGWSAVYLPKGAFHSGSLGFPSLETWSPEFISLNVEGVPLHDK